MFCEKCGAKIEDGSVFCEKCGARIEGNDENIARPSSSYEDGSAGRYSPGANYKAQSMRTDEFTVMLKNFFVDPINTIRDCADRDYSMHGIILLGCKNLLITLIFAVFKNIIASYATGFYWLYNITAPAAFLVILLMLLIGDGCWVALAIGIRKVINNEYEPKKMIGSIALGQIYVPVIVVAGIIITALFKYTGANISYLVGIMIVSFVQYECITATSGKSEKKKAFYGMCIAAFIFAILWGIMFFVVERIFMFWGAY